MEDRIDTFSQSMADEVEMARLDSHPDVQAVDLERAEEEKTKLAEREKAATDAYRGTPIETMGPSNYDYLAAYDEGVDFQVGQLPNKHIGVGSSMVQGYDIGDGHDVLQTTPRVTPEGAAYERAGIAKLQAGMRMPDGAAPATDMPALGRLAIGAQLNGVETFDQWVDSLGDTGHDRNTLSHAWAAAERTQLRKGLQEAFDFALSEEDILAGTELDLEMDEPLPDIEPEALVEDADWMAAAEKLYRMEEGEDFDGTPEELVQYSLVEMSKFAWNTASMSAYVADILGSDDPEYANAFLQLLDKYDRVNVGVDGFGRAVGNILLDPLTWLGGGLGALAFKGIAGVAAKKLAIQMLSPLAKRVIVGAGAAAVESAASAALLDAERQQIEMAAGQRQEESGAQTAVAAGVGAAVGATLGAAGGTLLGPEAFRAGRAMYKRGKQNWSQSGGFSPMGSPAAQRGSFSLAEPPSAKARPSERSAKAIAQERAQPANPRPGELRLESVPTSNPDELSTRTGAGLLPDDTPVTHNGKDIPDWEPEDWAEFGKQHGVENLGPLTPDVDVEGFAIPGGLDGTFTFVDLMKLKAEGHNPRKMSMETRIGLQRKLSRTVTPPEGDQVETFNRYVFGMLSPNQPLTANEFEYARVRAQDIEGIKEWAKLATWEPGSPPGIEERRAFDKALAVKFGTQAAGEGGLGLKGTAEYSAVAEMAKLYLRDPDFFTKKSTESWHEFVEKVMSQTRGLSAKVASFSTVWQDPMEAAISAVDRHMGAAFKSELLNTPEMRVEFDHKVVTAYNSWAKKQGLSEAINVDEVMQSKGGSTVVANTFMNYITAASNPKLRLKGGGINPSIPEHLQTTDWVVEPEKVAVIGETYRRALAANDALAQQQGLHLFSSQWMIWDGLRGRLEPHEVMFPGLYKLPKPSRQQLGAALQEHKAAGFAGAAKRAGPADELTGEPTKEMVPVEETKAWQKSGGMDWKRGAYFSILPMLGAGGLSVPDEGDGA